MSHPSAIFRAVLGKLLRPIAWLLRPLLRCHSWWMPLRLGRLRLVVLPDTVAILLCMMGAILILPYWGWAGIGVFCMGLLLAPFVLLNLVVVASGRVSVVRLCLLLPYWVHRLPHGAEFELYEAWEDPVPTGVAFHYDDIRRDPVHIGTVASAEPLYRHFQALLEQRG